MFDNPDGELPPLDIMDEFEDQHREDQLDDDESDFVVNQSPHRAL